MDPLPTWAVVGNRLIPMVTASRERHKDHVPYDLEVAYVGPASVDILVYVKGTKKVQERHRLWRHQFDQPGGWTANDYYHI